VRPDATGHSDPLVASGAPFVASGAPFPAATHTPQALSFVHRAGRWDLSRQARVVGILNVTPDSFSDGGRFLAPERAIAHAERMAEEGADAIDVGGQSTRPGGAGPVGADEEWARVGPVLEALAGRVGIPLSIDTYWGDVARRALDVGVAMVNDVSGLRVDPALADAAARAGAGLVLMHSRGAPAAMHARYEYEDLPGEIGVALAAAAGEAQRRGVARERIALDPGIGFSKRAEQSLEALRGLPRLTALGYPLYIGVSRKSFLGAWSGRPVGERLAAGLAVSVAAYALGARIFRTHDVRETRDALRAAEAVLAPATETESAESRA